jgi:hypothetical protein
LADIQALQAIVRLDDRYASAADVSLAAEFRLALGNGGALLVNALYAGVGVAHLYYYFNFY